MYVNVERQYGTDSRWSRSGRLYASTTLSSCHKLILPVGGRRSDRERPTMRRGIIYYYVSTVHHQVVPDCSLPPASAWACVVCGSADASKGLVFKAASIDR